MYATNNAREISTALASRQESVLAYLFPAGERHGEEFCVGSVRGEPGQSLKVHLSGEKAGVWRDFATEDQGGDLLDLWAVVRCGGDLRQAITEAADWVGAIPSLPRRIQKNTRMMWTYTDVEGTPWIRVERKDWGERKSYMPFDLKAGVPIGNGYSLPEPRPLYNLDRLHVTDQTVLFVEGEKAADALTSLGFLTTTTLGGAQAPHKTDFRPLAHKICFIWPDHDTPGAAYAKAVRGLILAAGGTGYILPVPEDKPEKWDAADAVEEGWTRDQVNALCQLAKDKAEQGKLHRFTLAEFLALELPEREYLLKPILSSQSLTLLHSQRGMGKTFVSLGLAYAVASGGTFLRWQAEKPRQVLFVDGEMPRGVLQERLNTMGNYAGDAIAASENLHIISADYELDGIPNLATPEGQHKIEERLDGIQFLILDNLSTLMSNGEENAAESWQPMQDWALKLRRSGVAVLFIHHSGKTGLQRGTSRREDILDTVLSLRRPHNYETDQGTRFEVHIEKGRGLMGVDLEPFEAVFTVNEHGHPTWAMHSLKAIERERAMDLARDGLTQRDIATELGMSLGKVNKLLNHARDLGDWLPLNQPKKRKNPYVP